MNQTWWWLRVVRVFATFALKKVDLAGDHEIFGGHMLILVVLQILFCSVTAAAGVAYFIVADRTVLARVWKNNFKHAPNIEA
ncbi:hypothetical protein J1N35_002965 [Gossypium stocksii]|uniref:Uncharacterized protein n=1 Tax=Gossypium stocksii TaxID=47602 RepID=A0A9D3WM62_9ROSI|nr:hypothetical protein J1N35_002965 [Gossypium stocksii]